MGCRDLSSMGGNIYTYLYEGWLTIMAAHEHPGIHLVFKWDSCLSFDNFPVHFSWHSDGLHIEIYYLALSNKLICSSCRALCIKLIYDISTILCFVRVFLHCKGKCSLITIWNNEFKKFTEVEIFSWSQYRFLLLISPCNFPSCFT